MKRSIFVMSLSFLVSITACSPTSSTEASAVTGNVVSTEPVPLGPTDRVIVRLSDVSLQDVAAPVLAEQITSGPGELPVPFVLSYDVDEIDPRNTYVVGARIERGSELLYINTTSYPVITHENPNEVDVVVEKVN